VSFTNATNGAGDTTRAVSLIVSSGDPQLPVITGVQLNSPATQMKVTIQWTTDLSTGSKVLYGTSPSSVTNLLSVAGNGTGHSVKLTGLAPGTVYYYEVISASSTNDNSGAYYTFTTTAPCPCN
jgi:phosphodiesterase/alkaline phosphatase D-like protein